MPPYLIESDRGNHALPSRAQDDFYGFSVAISGNYAIVGAFQEDEDGYGEYNE